MMFNGQVNGNNGHTAAADAGGGRKKIRRPCSALQMKNLSILWQSRATSHTEHYA